MPINRHSVGLTVLNATLLVACSLTGQPLSAEEVPPGGLCTQEQMQLEQQRMKLMDHPIIQATRKSVREIYEKSPLANTRAGAETLACTIGSTQAVWIAVYLRFVGKVQTQRPWTSTPRFLKFEWFRSRIC